MSKTTDPRNEHRTAARPRFGFFGEWAFQFVLLTAVIAALFDGAASLNGTIV
jgi:hypothetical protein